MLFRSGQNVFSNAGGSFPNTNNPGNVIALMAGDHYLGNETSGSATGDVYYWTEGYAPNRRFVIYYHDVNACCSATSASFSGRLVLYETLGLVDFIVESNLQSGPNVMGLQNGSKTIGLSPAGMDYITSPMTTSQAWRFFPPTNYLTQWNYNSGSGSTSLTSGYNLFSQTISPTVTTTYSLQYVNTLTGCANATNSLTVVVPVSTTVAPSSVNTLSSLPTVCNPQTFSLSTNYSGSLAGLVLNWQSSLNGTTWTAISGATSSSYTLTHNVSTYYRIQFTDCAGNITYSSSLQVGHSCGVPGCTVASACNYNAAATVDNGSCTYAVNWYLDTDADGYYSSLISSCTSPGSNYSNTISLVGDCNDGNAAIHPNAIEICNTIDDNCNISIDEGLSTSNTTTASACDSYTWSVNGQSYTTSGTYTSVTGCHTETLVLTITPSTNNTTTASACDSYTWSVNGQSYTTSGTYKIGRAHV